MVGHRRPNKTDKICLGCSNYMIGVMSEGLSPRIYCEICEKAGYKNPTVKKLESIEGDKIHGD